MMDTIFHTSKFGFKVCVCIILSHSHIIYVDLKNVELQMSYNFTRVPSST